MAALSELENLPYDATNINQEKQYVLKKLDISETEFAEIMKAPNKTYMDYPSYYPLLEKVLGKYRNLLSLFFLHKPMSAFQMDMRKGQ
mgnify:CR=1 FL=1